MTTAPQEHVFMTTPRCWRRTRATTRASKPRQLQMIAIGGAIGTGLFLGAGGRLHNAGPGLFLSYAFCGIFVFLILRALGELVLHRPSSGSFVSYAREFLGEKAAFVAGWMYWLNWAFTAMSTAPRSPPTSTTGRRSGASRSG
jgi:Gamma-aminobutyrate permease and related permeases